MEQLSPLFPGTCIAIVGMNGVGKSQFGRTLASKLHMKRIDTDKEFRKLHGKEEDYIATHGWEAFRREEEALILRSLLSNHVVILGGGAIESPAVRSALKEHAMVLWMQAGHRRVHKNLQRAKLSRPEFADGVNPMNVKKLLAERTPLYEEIANVTLPGTLRFSEQVPTAMKLLHAAIPSSPSP